MSRLAVAWRSSSWPARLAVFAWAAWLFLMATMATMLLLRVPHPHFLPLTALLVATVGSWMALVVVAGCWIARRRERREALAWLLIGSVPMCMFAAHGMYGLRAGFTRQIDMNLALKVMEPLGESLMDLEARFRYPQRTAGAKVMMISAPMPESEASRQVAAMDRHVRALEARLGRSARGRVHWVRGPLLGIEGRALHGVCIGSTPQVGRPEGEELNSLDRHEVAHCFLSGLTPASSEPPALLVEGWAEAAAADDPLELATRAWEWYERGEGLSIRELCGPEWYGRHEWPVYNQGGPLVDFLLRRFGPERFLELYTTTRPATFEADCVRLLGLDLDELDVAFRENLHRRVAGDRLRPLRPLPLLALGPGIEPRQWSDFLDECATAIDRLLRPYGQARVVVECEHVDLARPEAGQPFTERLELTRSGDLQSLRIVYRESEEVYLASPRSSFWARRPLREGQHWTLYDEPDATPEQRYRRVLDRIGTRDGPVHFGAMLLEVAEELRRRVNPRGMVVTQLERADEGGRPVVRLALEDRQPDPGQPWRKLSCVLAADALYAVLSYRYEGPEDEIAVGTAWYDEPFEGVPMLRSLRVERRGPDGTRTAGTWTVLERRFGPTAESQFAPELVLRGLPTRRADPDEMAEEPLAARLGGLYPLPLLVAAGCLVGGLLATRFDGPPLPKALPGFEGGVPSTPIP